MTKRSRAKGLYGYSFMVVFANDGIVDAQELQMLEKLALEDKELDEQEKQVLRNIFCRVN